MLSRAAASVCPVLRKADIGCARGTAEIECARLLWATFGLLTWRKLSCWFVFRVSTGRHCGEASVGAYFFLFKELLTPLISTRIIYLPS